MDSHQRARGETRRREPGPTPLFLSKSPSETEKEGSRTCGEGAQRSRAQVVQPDRKPLGVHSVLTGMPNRVLANVMPVANFRFYAELNDFLLPEVKVEEPYHFQPGMPAAIQRQALF